MLSHSTCYHVAINKCHGPPLPSTTTTPCGTFCPVCRKTNTPPPVHRRRLVDALDAEHGVAARDRTKITPGNIATKLLEKKRIWATRANDVKAPLVHCLVIELWLSDILTMDISTEARVKGATPNDITCFYTMQEGSQFEMNKNNDDYWQAINCANKN